MLPLALPVARPPIPKLLANAVLRLTGEITLFTVSFLNALLPHVPIRSPMKRIKTEADA